MKTLIISLSNDINNNSKQIPELAPSEFVNFITVALEKTDDEAVVLNKVIKETSDEYSHIVILPTEYVLYNNYLDIIKEYYKDEKTIYCPLVELKDSEGNFKGVINSSIWWPSFTQQPGILDIEAAIKQVDTTLYGSLIPLSLLKKYKFKKDLNIYYQFEFLNKISSTNNKIQGVPKILLSVVFDYMVESCSKEKKAEMFENARKEYLKK
jgi:hypothetical protein